jgi:multiple sugar transport system permease protein
MWTDAAPLPPARPVRRRRRGVAAAGTAARYVFLYGAAALFLLPVVWMFSVSLRTQRSLFDNPLQLIPTDLRLDAYVEIWQQIPFGQFFLNTVIFAGAVTILSLFFDSLTAYALARLHWDGRKAFFWMVLIVLMVPFQITLVPLFLVVYDLGLLDSYPGLILPRITNAFGIFLLRQFFISLPRDLDEAARLDGASEFGVYWRIILPLSRPALITLAIFHFMYNWNDLLWPLIITTSPEMRTLPTGLALFMGAHVVDHPIVMAGAAISLAPLLVGFLFAQRHFIRSVAMTGID